MNAFQHGAADRQSPSFASFSRLLAAEPQDVGRTSMSLQNELVEAAFNGQVEEVVRLIDAGGDINAVEGWWNPLHSAIESEEIDAVQFSRSLAQTSISYPTR